MRDWPVHFSDHFRGLFKLESSTTIIRDTRSELLRGIAIMDKGDFSSRSLINFTDISAIPLASIDTLLTYLHEQDHHKVLLSTPVGLLLWRIEQCLTVDVNYLRRKRPNVTQGSHSCLLDALCLSILNESTPVAFVDETRLTAQGSLTLRYFLHALIERSDITIGDFVEIATESLKYLAHRSGLKPKNIRWITDLDLKLPFIQKETPTLLEILEASARCRELTNLEYSEVSRRTIDDWQRACIFDVYKPAFCYLMRELGDPSWGKIAIDVALSSPIDISVPDEDAELRVEDIIPSYRLEKIVNEIKSRVWTLNQLGEPDSNLLYNKIPQSLGWSSASEIYLKLKTSDLSFNANWGGKLTIDSGGQIDVEDEEIEQSAWMFTSQPYLDFLELQYKENFSARVANPLYFVTTQKDRAHDTILTFFSDQMEVSGELIKGDFKLVFGAFKHFLESEKAREFIYGIEPFDYSLYFDLFKKFSVSAGVPEDQCDRLIAFLKIILSDETGLISTGQYTQLFEEEGTIDDLASSSSKQ